MIDPNIEDIFQKYEIESSDLMARFLDDILKVYLGSVQDLHNFFEEIYAIHPSIKFTMSNTSTNFKR